MKRINFWIRNFFGFSALETKGFVLLFAIISLALTIPPLFQYFYTSQTTRTNHLSATLLDSLLINLDSEPVVKRKPNFARSTKNLNYKSIQPVNFDPNVVNITTLVEIGFPKKTAQNLIRYRNKGGKFRQKSDVKKIYGVSEKLYKQIETYILLPDTYTRKPKKPEDFSQYKKKFPKDALNEKNQKKLHFDLNQVDAETLKQVRGIGNVLSQRIIKFRKQLGGFVKIEQVREVYGLKPEVANKLLSYCFLGDSTVTQININQASLEELRKHPYIDYSIAKAIVNYRAQHGNYSGFEELLQIKIINSEILDKIAPYLSI